VAAAWQGKELLRAVYATDGMLAARAALDRFYRWCDGVQTPELSRLARTVRAWQAEILAWHATGGCSNGASSSSAGLRLQQPGTGVWSRLTGRRRVTDDLTVHPDVTVGVHERPVVVDLKVRLREVVERLGKDLGAALGQVEVQRVGRLSLDRREGRIVGDLEDAEGLAEGNVHTIALVDDDEMVVAGRILGGSRESTLRYRIEVLHARVENGWWISRVMVGVSAYAAGTIAIAAATTITASTSGR
jgi:hypothetical protein